MYALPEANSHFENSVYSNESLCAGLSCHLSLVVARIQWYLSGTLEGILFVCLSLVSRVGCDEDSSLSFLCSFGLCFRLRLIELLSFFPVLDAEPVHFCVICSFVCGVYLKLSLVTVELLDDYGRADLVDLQIQDLINCCTRGIIHRLPFDQHFRWNGLWCFYNTEACWILPIRGPLIQTHNSAGHHQTGLLELTTAGSQYSMSG
jgi:hypothetical protein